MSTLSPLTLASRQQSKKPRMLVVDDEPDNLDLLFRTFRRDFKVLKAESGVEALEILADDGEVAVIISDQRMPEMKGTEFLSKTVPDFPDTVRIILTGFTDVEDLVEAINAGQVYRYITKPWDPDELKFVVDKASATYELLKGQSAELHKAEKQSKMMMTVGQIAAQSMQKEEALEHLTRGFCEILNADACALLLADDDSAGSYGLADTEKISDSQLVTDAIASQQSQTLVNIQSDETLSSSPLYTDGTQCHLAIPVIYQGKALGTFSFQWTTPYKTLDDVSQLLGLIAPQIALSLKAAVL
ncbi:response regulator [cf. Phormidesmis sp. LEGE 11477]|uniref:response regulator n=1 Tax=cf. Phormidesmis sp. LEGE 11477 TaxID=1828680 RepID=UPI00188144C7|nr:response regulator [cf. Phormidesmis sp. LEGE 11477]MBE9064172.1 response regulator [cf. Phormidesmis sp. LEGE 11477]